MTNAKIKMGTIAVIGGVGITTGTLYYFRDDIRRALFGERIDKEKFDEGMTQISNGLDLQNYWANLPLQEHSEDEMEAKIRRAIDKAVEKGAITLGEGAQKSGYLDTHKSEYGHYPKHDDETTEDNQLYSIISDYVAEGTPVTDAIMENEITPLHDELGIKRNVINIYMSFSAHEIEQGKEKVIESVESDTLADKIDEIITELESKALRAAILGGEMLATYILLRFGYNRLKQWYRMRKGGGGNAGYDRGYTRISYYPNPKMNYMPPDVNAAYVGTPKLSKTPFMDVSLTPGPELAGADAIAASLTDVMTTDALSEINAQPEIKAELLNPNWGITYLNTHAGYVLDDINGERSFVPAETWDSWSYAEKQKWFVNNNKQALILQANRNVAGAVVGAHAWGASGFVSFSGEAMGAFDRLIANFARAFGSLVL